MMLMSHISSVVAATGNSSLPLPLKTVDCSNAHLAIVPVNISQDTQAILLARNFIKPEDISNFPGVKNLTLLDLSSNHFYTLEESRLVAPSLTHLILDHDELDYLSNRIFTGVLHLHFLSISHNKIEIIHSNTFDGLHQLHSLVLAHNRIFAVNPNWFLDLQDLGTLDLTGNNIHVLWNQGFRFLTGLKSLILKNNRLNHVYEDAFVGLLELEELYLQNNHLKIVPSLALQYFPTLNILDLSGNHFKQLATGSIVSVNVTTLKMNGVKELEFVDKHAFHTLPYLRTLELNHNKALMYIHLEAFHDVASLEQLFLRDASLLVLEHSVIEALPSLSLLDLTDNRGVHCDCTWGWLRGVQTPLSDNNSTLLDAGSNASIIPTPFPNGTFSTYPGLLPTSPNTSSSVVGRMNLSVLGLQDAYCRLPGDLNGLMLSTFITLSDMSHSCAPRIVPLLPEELNTVLGEDVVFTCRGYGEPAPRVYWVTLESDSLSTSKETHLNLHPRSRILPETEKQEKAGMPGGEPKSKTLSDTTEHTRDSHPRNPSLAPQSTAEADLTLAVNHSQSNETQSAKDTIIAHSFGKGAQIIQNSLTSRIRADSTGTLSLDYIQGADSGIYKCVAENEVARAEKTVKLRVRTVLADVIIVHVSSSSITVTWKSAVYDRDFQLFYKPKETNDTYKIVDLRPYMRSYTGRCWVSIQKTVISHASLKMRDRRES